MGHFSVFIKIFPQLSSNIYWGLKKREIVNLAIFVVFFFFNDIILGGNIVNISKTIFLKLIFHLQPSYQLPADLLQEFYIHSTCVISHCI